MADTNTIPDHYTIQFDRNWKTAIQQLTERLRAFVTVHTDTKGKAATHNRVEPEEMEEQSERIAPTEGDELTTVKRWVFPRPHQKTTYIDEWDADLLGETVLPTGSAVVAHRAAAARKMDKIIIDGVTGANLEGASNEPSGLTTKTVLTANKVAIDFDYETAADSGLTLNKLIKAKSLFGELEVYGQDQKGAGEVLVMAVNQNHLDSLLLDPTITSADYAAVKALINGEINYFMGFTFIRTQQMPANAAGTGHYAYAWAKSHAHFNVWQDFRSRMSIRDDLSEAIQIRSKLMAGACRDQDEALVQIDNLTVAAAS